jgi:hypothetical protein
MSQGCQWIGPDQDPQKTHRVDYCGRVPLWPGRSYCEEHVWRVYQKGTGLNNRREVRRIEKMLQKMREIGD